MPRVTGEPRRRRARNQRSSSGSVPAHTRWSHACLNSAHRLMVVRCAAGRIRIAADPLFGQVRTPGSSEALNDDQDAHGDKQHSDDLAFPHAL
jgi:hypothetical protein